MISNTKQRTLGQRLRQERERLHWSQEYLADQLGTTTSTINRWEHDRTVPQPRFRARLCQVFEQNLDALFGSPADEQEFPQEPICIWSVPYPRNLYFTGREEVLVSLHEAFTTGNTVALTQPQAIHGMGGIGKTQTAIEYAYRYQSEYRAVLWVKADSPQSLISDVVALADVLELPERREEDSARVMRAFKRWLQVHSQWLLILDNADDLEGIYDFLSLGNGHILVMTRASALGPHLRGIELEKMALEEGTLLLLRRSKRLTREVELATVAEIERRPVEALSALVDGLPLALDQIASYIEETHCGFADYLLRYRLHRADLLQRRGAASKRDYPHTVATCWSLSFQQVAQADPMAAEVLLLCAFLHPDAIPEEVLAAGVARGNAQGDLLADDPLRWDSAMGELCRYSLVRRNEQTKTLSLHRLVQLALRDTLSQEEQRAWAERAVRAVSQLFPEVEFGTWPLCQRYLSQVPVCAEWIEQWQIQSLEAAQLLYRAANYLHERGQLVAAEPLYRDALALREHILGRVHPDVAAVLKDMGMLSMAQANYEQAEQLCLRALAIQEQTLGPQHLQVAITLNDLAMAYYLWNKYEQVELLYQRALRIFEEQLEPTHPYLAVSRNNLAKLYVAQGRYTEAEPLLLQALTIRQQVFGPNHPDVANSLHHLATLYAAQGSYEQAEPFYQRALTLREESLGLQHHDVAQTLLGLAQLYTAQNRAKATESLYQRALMIYEQVWGPDHPQLIQLQTMLSCKKREGHT